MYIYDKCLWHNMPIYYPELLQAIPLHKVAFCQNLVRFITVFMFVCIKSGMGWKSPAAQSCLLTKYRPMISRFSYFPSKHLKQIKYRLIIHNYCHCIRVEKKVAWIQSHHLHLQWISNYGRGKFAWSVKAKHCWDCQQIFCIQKFCLYTFPAHNLNFHLKGEGDGIESTLSS